MKPDSARRSRRRVELRGAKQWATDSARLGERAVAERWLAAQNLSDDELLARYRAEMARRAAASAASAPK
jgi:hypothetical protein